MFEEVKSFDPANWYWLVGRDMSRVYSSRVGGYVAAANEVYADWLAEGYAVTRIANEFELEIVLRQYGMSLGRVFTAEETLAALTLIDAGLVREGLGRENIGEESLVDGDADKLRSTALRVGMQGSPPAVEGAELPITPEERLGRLEESRTEAE